MSENYTASNNENDGPEDIVDQARGALLSVLHGMNPSTAVPALLGAVIVVIFGNVHPNQRRSAMAMVHGQLEEFAISAAAAMDNHAAAPTQKKSLIIMPGDE